MANRLEENPLFMKLCVDDKAIARSEAFLASFEIVVKMINVERPPKNMLDWFLKFLFEARYTNLPKSTWRELFVEFGGCLSVRKAQGILMVMKGREVVGFVSAKRVGQIADKVQKQPIVSKQAGGYTPKGCSLFRAAMSTQVNDRRPEAPVGQISRSR